MDTTGLQIKKLNKHDLPAFQKLVQLFHEVFEMKDHIYPNESYLRTLLENSYFVAFVIQNKNEILGGLTAYELPQYYFENSELFLYDLAIKQEFQRKGLGKQLLLKLKEYCKERKIEVFFVKAHADDKNAIDFYQSTRGQAENVVHFNYKIN